MRDPEAVPPPVNLVLNRLELASLRQQVNDTILVEIIRDEVRQWKPLAISVHDAAAQVAAAVAERAKSMLLAPRAVVNATGIIIHTGWGNAPLHIAARERLLTALAQHRPAPQGSSKNGNMREASVHSDWCRSRHHHDAECREPPIGGRRARSRPRNCGGGARLG